MTTTCDLTVRPETPRDHGGIASLTRRAFGQDDEAEMIARIRASDGFDPALSLVAVEDGTPIGHILFSGIRIEAGGDGVAALALAPMAVHPDRQRRGIGSRLVREGLAACRRVGHGIVVVVGHAEFYPRFGFRRCRDYGISAPFAVPDESFRVLGLTPRALDGVSGVVRYPPAFGIGS